MAEPIQHNIEFVVVFCFCVCVVAAELSDLKEMGFSKEESVRALVAEVNFVFPVL